VTIAIILINILIGKAILPSLLKVYEIDCFRPMVQSGKIRFKNVTTNEISPLMSTVSSRARKTPCIKLKITDSTPQLIAFFNFTYPNN